MNFMRIVVFIRFGDVRNVNWVGGEPTPNLPFILEVLNHTKALLPQVWNSNMYMTHEVVSLLEGIADVYLADFKWGPGECSKKLSRVHNYWDIVTRNHLLANHHAEIVLRHLVMPGHTECCSRPILEWVAKNLDCEKILVNIMNQYRPEYKAFTIPEIARRITDSEYVSVVSLARNLGLQLT